MIWKKYIFEFVVIVVGITFSFLVEEWRTDRQEEAFIRRTLIQTKEELKSYLEVEKDFLKYTRTVDSVRLRIINHQVINDDSISRELLFNDIYFYVSTPGINNSRSRIPSLFYLLESDLVSKVTNKGLLKRLRLVSFQLAAIHSSESYRTDFVSRFSAILIRNGLASQYTLENMSLNWRETSILKLVNDDDFVKLMAEVHIYSVPIKEMEGRLWTNVIPKAIKEIELELDN